MFIRSERLFLRPGWPEDWSELTARIAEPAIVRNLASAPWPYAASDAKDFLALEPDRRYPRLVVTLPTAAGSELIGCAGLAACEGEVELGYWISRPHWGRGYASEAARAILSLARTLGHRRIVASHFSDNPASGRVLAKLGFRPTGRQVLRYSMGRREQAPASTWTINLADSCGEHDPASDLAHMVDCAA
jgi:RimJ/RimL family protein N-acetyltransferase